ncbi:MAG: hypothetical protein RLZZ175_3252 [Bacteroidota bacterium]|jgi:hypothetical protein
MHNIEPYFNWSKYYSSNKDPKSPHYQAEYNLTQYENTIYGYYIHPLWDYIGSETLYIKILFVDYTQEFAIIEFLGEWNDALHNDIMHLKRNIIDLMTHENIRHFILIGEHVLNFHGSDDCYYEEWFEDIEDGWIAAINFREHVTSEWPKYMIDNYVNFGGTLDIENWRTLTPKALFELVNQLIIRRLN